MGYLAVVSDYIEEQRRVCLPSGHSVLARPVNFIVTALILTFFVTFKMSFPRKIDVVLEPESRVVPS